MPLSSSPAGGSSRPIRRAPFRRSVSVRKSRSAFLKLSNRACGESFRARIICLSSRMDATARPALVAPPSSAGREVRPPSSAPPCWWVTAAVSTRCSSAGCEAAATSARGRTYRRLTFISESPSSYAMSNLPSPCTAVIRPGYHAFSRLNRASTRTPTTKSSASERSSAAFGVASVGFSTGLSAGSSAVRFFFGDGAGAFSSSKDASTFSWAAEGVGTGFADLVGEPASKSPSPYSSSASSCGATDLVAGLAGEPASKSSSP
mmetsp:Transcript_16893/g.39482  ORF Transcript_16893/g.39482 Transcript_16893/m.39482 type:complete len:262 (-) Transcript_16893:8-793(-)